MGIIVGLIGSVTFVIQTKEDAWFS